MPSNRYGSYSLRYGDFDPGARSTTQNGRYGGIDIPGPNNPGYVKQLQEDLRTLGFLIVGMPDGIFGRNTEFALREFQVYARFGKIAQQFQSNPTYAKGLVRADNPNVYVGAVSGQLNDSTTESLVGWLENDMRCPVVIEARRTDRHGNYDPAVPPLHQNIWLPREVISREPRMFAVDFTDRFDNVAPADFRDSNGRIVLGDVNSPTANMRPGGPRTYRLKHSLTSAEILPESLIGRPWNLLSPAEQSTFRVIRSVADIECLGTFDAMNAYDNAVMSVGPYHHILLQERGFRRNSPASAGELGAFLAYLQLDHPNSYVKLLENNGAGFEPITDGRTNWEHDSAGLVYRAFIKLQSADGTFSIEPNTFELAEYFRGWHWFYRFSAALRTDDDLRNGFWFMTRIRLWDILNAVWDNDYEISPPTGPNRLALIGDIFRSEKAVAMLLRYHVALPGSILRRGRASNFLRWVLNSTGIDYMVRDPKYWNDLDERNLVEKLIDGFERGYVTSSGTRRHPTKPWTRGHAKQLFDWPESQGRRYSGVIPSSRLGQVSDGDALRELSISREYGFQLQSPEWGTPPWE